MTRAEYKRFLKWCNRHEGTLLTWLMWCCTAGWVIPVIIGYSAGILIGFLAVLPCLIGPPLLLWGANKAILRVRVQSGGSVTYEYSLERLEAREAAVARREQAVRELEARTRYDH